MDTPLLNKYGLNKHWIDEYQKYQSHNQFLGRVTRMEKDWDQIITNSGIINCERRLGINGSDEVTIGDWITWQDILAENNQIYRISNLLPRKNSLRRQSSKSGVSKAQIFGSNIDNACIIQSMDQKLNQKRIIRLIILILNADIKPVFILTKCDLSSQPELLRAQKMIKEIFHEARIYNTENKQNKDLIDLSKNLSQHNKTSILIGQSGAGKSTLINNLYGKNIMSTGEVRQTDKRGKHTTTYSELIAMPMGGTIIDTPGIRSVGLWQADHGIRLYFKQIYEHENNCKFSDCSHIKEQSCDIKQQVEQGQISQKEYNLWKELITENDKTY